MEIISLFQNLLLPVATAWIVIRIGNDSGVWYYFLTVEVLTLLGIMASIWLNKRRITWNAENLLLLL